MKYNMCNCIHKPLFSVMPLRVIPSRIYSLISTSLPCQTPLLEIETLGNVVKLFVALCK